MNDLNLDFRSLKGHTHSNQFLFSVISFSLRNSKTTRDRRIVPSEENIRNFVFCRMAPSIMTSGDPDCQNCFRFVLVLRVRFAQKHATDLRRFFTARCYSSAVLAMALCPSVRPSVRLSVCLSVRPSQVGSTKTAKGTITNTTPHDSPRTLVF